LARCQQDVGEFAAGFVVELIAFHVDPSAGRADRLGERRERRGAVDQQVDLVPGQERHMGEPLSLLAHQRQGVRRVRTGLCSQKVRTDAGRRRSTASERRHDGHG